MEIILLTTLKVDAKIKGFRRIRLWTVELWFHELRKATLLPQHKEQ